MLCYCTIEKWKREKIKLKQDAHLAFTQATWKRRFIRFITNTHAWKDARKIFIGLRTSRQSRVSYVISRRDKKTRILNSGLTSISYTILLYPILSYYILSYPIHINSITLQRMVTLYGFTITAVPSKTLCHISCFHSSLTTKLKKSYKHKLTTGFRCVITSV